MRFLASALVAVLLAGLAAVGPLAASTARAASDPKVAIIVGATHGTTPTYRSYADQIAATALKYTPNVVKVYSPRATWARVKAAIDGASIIVYLGHGNGWPSPYTYDPNYTTKDGFGLNYDTNGDGKFSDYENRYYGEPYIRTLTPAKNAVVLLFHLCYASGNSEPGQAAPTLTVARQRVDNYAAAFIKAGARAVIANGRSHAPYYIDALFNTRQTIDQYWRNAPDFNSAVKTYGSSRNPGYAYQLDPSGSTAFYRSIAGNMALTTTQVTGAAFARTDGDPATFAVPGNASPTTDGAPVFGGVDAAVAGTDPVATLATSTKVRVDARDAAVALDGSPIFQIHTDDGVAGWMTGSSLVPRDSLAPRVWDADTGAGAFSPDGDGRQDDWTLTVTLSESAGWRLRVKNGAGEVLASATGTGDTATLHWAPPAGSVPDGTYRWELRASDAWDNGPLDADGSVVVDTQAPELSLAAALADNAPVIAPNGDGFRETISISGTSSEAGSLVATVRDEAGAAVATLSTPVSGSPATLTWDGRTDAGGFVPDGSYRINVRARDAAGNLSQLQMRPVDVYAALGFVTSSKAQFFPQDGDRLARATTLSMRLLSPATVTWTVIDAKGSVVRTFATDEPMTAGTVARSWDGRTDAGTFAPRGTYRSQVRATDGTHEAVQLASVLADAFRYTVSDRTPARGQRITVTVVTSESLSRAPRIGFYQPGISGWSVSTSKVATNTYRVTVTLKSSKTGTLRIKATGVDSDGRTQSSNLSLPLH